MRKVLVIDRRRSLNDDLRMQLIVNGTEDLYRITACNPSDPKNLKAFVGGKLFDFVLIEHGEMAERCSPDCFGDMKLYGYSVSRDVPKHFDEAGIPFMGQAAGAEDILRIIGEVYDGKIPDSVSSEKQSAPDPAETRPSVSPDPAPGSGSAVLSASAVPQTSPLRGNMILEKQLKDASRPFEEPERPQDKSDRARTIAVWSAKPRSPAST